MTSSAATQVYIQGFELARPIIYAVYDLLESVKGLVLRNHGCGISKTRGSSRVSEGSSSEDPVLMVSWRPGALSLTNNT